MPRLVNKLDRPFSPRTTNYILAASRLIVGLAILAAIVFYYASRADPRHRDARYILAASVGGALAMSFITQGLSCLAASWNRVRAGNALFVLFRLSLCAVGITFLAWIVSLYIAG